MMILCGLKKKYERFVLFIGEGACADSLGNVMWVVNPPCHSLYGSEQWDRWPMMKS